MAGWTAPPSFTSHAILSSANMGIISADLAFLGAVPVGLGLTTAGVTFVAASASPTQIAMDFSWQSGGMAFGSSEFTVPFAGKYLVFGQVIYSAADTSSPYYQAQIYQNGSAMATGSVNTAATALITVEVEYTLTCNASDVIALYGIADNTSSSYSATGTLGVLWVSN